MEIRSKMNRGLVAHLGYARRFLRSDKKELMCVLRLGAFALKLYRFKLVSATEKSWSFLVGPRVLYTNVSSTFVNLSVVSKPKHCLENVNIRTHKRNLKNGHFKL